ncbi:MAG: HU family DNA-binding protein [Muribaculaceae bacterium]|nr:HU family DNA-binding protein [Muribaculaceae bacterium]
MDSRQLTEKVAAAMNRSREEVETLVQNLSIVVSKTAIEMDSVMVAGFGTFEPRKRMERVALNPSTGKRLLLPPRLLLGFRPSALLKQKVK